MSYHRLHIITTTPPVRSTGFSFLRHHFHFKSSRVAAFCGRTNLTMEVLDKGQVVVGDTASLQKKIAAVRNAGPSKLQVIADFDGTLTKYNINCQRGHSKLEFNIFLHECTDFLCRTMLSFHCSLITCVASHALLQQGNQEYDIKRQKLYDHYHPLEICPTIPVEEKTKLMEEWWEKTHALLVEGGLTYDDIRKSVANARIAFREGVIELFEILEDKDVPVLIFSAGLADIIEEVLRQKVHRSFKNIEIVSNRMVFSDDGHLLAFKGKTIHVLNKNEHALDMAAPLHDTIGNVDGPAIDYAAMKRRTNVLLLGDHFGDLGMSDGLNYETRISVGFLNDKVNESLESYSKAFDVVCLNDAPMSEVVNLVSQLIQE